MTSAGGSQRWTGRPSWMRLRGVSALATVALALFLAAGAGAQPERKGVPVTFDGQVLFLLYAPFGAITSEQRAALAEKRILAIARDPFYSRELFTVRMEGATAQAFYRNQLVGITRPEDAAAAGRSSTLELMSERVRIVEGAIALYRTRRTPQAWKRAGIGLAVATAALIGLLLGLRWLHRRLLAGIDARRRAGATLRLRQQQVMPPERLAALQRRALRVARIVVGAIFVLAYLETAFALFPLTRGYTLALFDYVVEPLRDLGVEFLANIGNFFSILVILVLTRYLLKLLRWLLHSAAAGLITLPGVAPAWSMHLYRVLRLGVIAVAAVMIYPYIPGSSSAAFKGIGIFAGALFTVGASGAAHSVIGGLVLIFSNSFRIGDRVKIGDVTGDVVETTFALTRIRTPKNEIVTIPNSAVLSGNLVNYSAQARASGLILHTSVTIGYDAPWRRVHELLVQAALHTKGILREPAPFVLQQELGDFSVRYEINGYTRDANAMVRIHGELHQNIQDAFNEAGVEILSPNYAALRDGKASTIPPEGRTPADALPAREPDPV